MTDISERALNKGQLWPGFDDQTCQHLSMHLPAAQELLQMPLGSRSLSQNGAALPATKGGEAAPPLTPGAA